MAPTMTKQLTRLEGKVDKLDERLDGVDKILVKQQVILDEHMRRTEINEKGLKLMQEQLHPLKRHVDMWAGVGKAIVLLSVLVALLKSIGVF
jgi:hypothetical protein